MSKVRRKVKHQAESRATRREPYQPCSATKYYYDVFLANHPQRRAEMILRSTQTHLNERGR